MSGGVAAVPRDRAEIIARAGSWARRNTWTLGLIGLLVVVFAITKLLQPNYGAAVLLYTSELKEIQLACDRAIVIFGGRVVAEIAVQDADEPTLLRAAYNLKSDAVIPELAAAETVAAEAAEAVEPVSDDPEPPSTPTEEPA